MPFVSVRILKGHSREKLDLLSRGVTDAVSGATAIPKENIWIVIEEVDASKWYVKGVPVSAASAG